MIHGWTRATLALLPLFLSPHVQAAPKLKNDYQIRVRLGEFQSFALNGYDLKINGRARLEDHRRVEIECRDTGRREEIVLDTVGTFPSPLRLEASGGYIFVNGQPFRDAIKIYYQKGRCLVVNELGLERYIAGVINNEMHGSWPLEALKAQAVAARSYAIAEIEHANPEARYHVEMDTRDQMYRGAASESIRANLATSSTRGNVLIFGKDVLRSFYHANCGGRTDLPSSVWSDQSKDAYRSVRCPYHFERNVAQRWSWKIDRPQLEMALRKVAGLLPAGFTRLASLQQGEMSPGNRQKTVVVTDAGGQRAEIPANLFRQSVGFTRLRSTKFEVHNGGGSVEFRGVGFGHGVGMCQVGAKEMALQGKSHLDILRFYYPLAQVMNLY